jgi:Uma2 family endonuclease
MAVEEAAMLVDVVRRRFTVEEFWRMAEAGLFLDRPRVELVDGEILDMTPIGPRHAVCVSFLSEWFVRRLAGRALLFPQLSLRIDPRTECQPDLVLVRPPRAAYRDANPAPSDVLLLVEVSDTSRAYDRQVKLPIYAGAGVPEVWIVDVVTEIVETHREPVGDRYREVQRLARGASVAPGAFPDLALPVDELFG